MRSCPCISLIKLYFCAMECQLFHGYHGKLSLIDKVLGPSELSLHNLWPKSTKQLNLNMGEVMQESRRLRNSEFAPADT